MRAKGLEQMLKWLQEIKEHYGCSQYDAQKFSKLECCYFPLVGSIMPCSCTWRIKTFPSNTKTCWTTDSRIGELTLFPEAAINNTLASWDPLLHGLHGHFWCAIFKHTCAFANCADSWFYTAPSFML